MKRRLMVRSIESATVAVERVAGPRPPIDDDWLPGLVLDVGVADVVRSLALVDSPKQRAAESALVSDLAPLVSGHENCSIHLPCAQVVPLGQFAGAIAHPRAWVYAWSR